MGVGTQTLMAYPEAMQRILESVKPLDSEPVELKQAFNRVLVSDIHAELDIPPFPRSMMDGYAIRSSDVFSASVTWPVEVPIGGELMAGGMMPTWIKPGTAMKIMTGAPIPEGFDAVIPQERVEFVSTSERIERALGPFGTQGPKGGIGANNPSGGMINSAGIIRVTSAVPPQANIAPRGEDVKSGERIMTKGMLIRAAELGMLAQLGWAEVEVYRRPRVAILATGDELVPVQGIPRGSQIRDSNSYSLWGQVLEVGGLPLALGMAGDKEDVLNQRIAEGLERSEALVIAGGMSVGDRDLVKGLLDRHGVRTDFWRVSIKPGKPFLYGRTSKTHVFGLPGNPVSAMVTFEVFVKPALRKMMGMEEVRSPSVRAKFMGRVKRQPGRMEFMRTQLRWVDDHYEVTLTGSQGSGILRSMVQADSLTIIPEEMSDIPSGTMLEVMPL